MVWEVGHPKMELGEPGTVSFVLMGGMSVIGGKGMIVEEMAEIHDLLQKILMVPPSLLAFRGHLCIICLLTGLDKPLCILIIPF